MRTVINMQAIQSCIVTSLCIMLPGCGYTVVKAAPTAHRVASTVALVPFTNQTYEPEVERHIQAAMQQMLQHNQSITVASPAAAQWHLTAHVQQLQTLPVAFDHNDNVLKYRLEVSLLLRLTAVAERQTRLRQEVTAATDYLVLPGRGVREEIVARETAFLRLAQQVAEQCADLLAIVFIG